MQLAGWMQLQWFLQISRLSFFLSVCFPSAVGLSSPELIKELKQPHTLKHVPMKTGVTTVVYGQGQQVRHTLNRRHLYNLKIFPLLFIKYIFKLSFRDWRKRINPKCTQTPSMAKPHPLRWCHYERLWFFSEYVYDDCVQVWKPVYHPECLSDV